MLIHYSDSRQAWGQFPQRVEFLVGRSSAVVVGDLGGGANPLLSMDFIRRHGLDYRVIDLQSEELKKCPEGYTKVQGDLASPDFAAEPDFDLVFSNMLVEHIPDPVQFHRNVFRMLKPGGLAFHYFPTLTSLPMLFNRVLNERAGQSILDRILPGVRKREGNLRKFPAYYRWCFGPLAFQRKRFESIGFEILEYQGCFGYQGYFSQLPNLLKIHQAFTDLLLRHPNAYLTDGAQVLLAKNATKEPIHPVHNSNISVSKKEALY